MPTSNFSEFSNQKLKKSASSLNVLEQATQLVSLSYSKSAQQQSFYVQSVHSPSFSQYSASLDKTNRDSQNQHNLTKFQCIQQQNKAQLATSPYKSILDSLQMLKNQYISLSVSFSHKRFFEFEECIFKSIRVLSGVLLQAIHKKTLKNQKLTEQLQKSQSVIKGMKGEVNQLKDMINQFVQSYSTQIAYKDKQIAHKDEQICDKEEQILKKNEQIAELIRHNDILQMQIEMSASNAKIAPQATQQQQYKHPATQQEQNKQSQSNNKNINCQHHRHNYQYQQSKDSNKQQILIIVNNDDDDQENEQQDNQQQNNQQEQDIQQEQNNKNNTSPSSLFYQQQSQKSQQRQLQQYQQQQSSMSLQSFYYNNQDLQRKISLEIIQEQQTSDLNSLTDYLQSQRPSQQLQNQQSYITSRSRSQCYTDNKQNSIISQNDSRTHRQTINQRNKSFANTTNSQIIINGTMDANKVTDGDSSLIADSVWKQQQEQLNKINENKDKGRQQKQKCKNEERQKCKYEQLQQDKQRDQNGELNDKQADIKMPLTQKKRDNNNNRINNAKSNKANVIKSLSIKAIKEKGMQAIKGKKGFQRIKENLQPSQIASPVAADNSLNSDKANKNTDTLALTASTKQPVQATSGATTMQKLMGKKIFARKRSTQNQQQDNRSDCNWQMSSIDGEKSYLNNSCANTNTNSHSRSIQKVTKAITKFFFNEQQPQIESLDQTNSKSHKKPPSQHSHSRTLSNIEPFNIKRALAESIKHSQSCANNMLNDRAMDKKMNMHQDRKQQKDEDMDKVNKRKDQSLSRHEYFDKQVLQSKPQQYLSQQISRINDSPATKRHHHYYASAGKMAKPQNFQLSLSSSSGFNNIQRSRSKSGGKLKVVSSSQNSQPHSHSHSLSNSFSNSSSLLNNNSNYQSQIDKFKTIKQSRARANSPTSITTSKNNKLIFHQCNGFTKGKGLIHLGGSGNNMRFKKLHFQKIKQAFKAYSLALPDQKMKIYQEGGKYSGTNKSENGYGTQVYSNGMMFQGTFKNGKYQGDGQFTLNGLSVFEGSFNQGAIQGQAYLKHFKLLSKYQCPKPLLDASYFGKMKNNTFEGMGTVFLNQKQKIVTKFEKGIPIGQLTYYSENGIEFGYWHSQS